MQRFDRKTTDPWFLSGKPVVRLWGRDFDVSPKRYAEWLLELARNYDVQVLIKQLSDPPGVIVQSWIGEEPEPLMDPLLVVNRKKMPWLFCSYKDCPHRIADGYPPGSVCGQHAGAR